MLFEQFRDDDAAIPHCTRSIDHGVCPHTPTPFASTVGQQAKGNRACRGKAFGIEGCLFYFYAYEILNRACCCCFFSFLNCHSMNKRPVEADPVRKPHRSELMAVQTLRTHMHTIYAALPIWSMFSFPCPRSEEFTHTPVSRLCTVGVHVRRTIYRGFVHALRLDCRVYSPAGFLSTKIWLINRCDVDFVVSNCSFSPIF